MKNAQTIANLALMTLIIVPTIIHCEMPAKKSLDIVTVSGKQVMMESETGKAIQDRLQKVQTDMATPLTTEEKKIRDKEQKLLKLKEGFDKDATEFEKTAKNLSNEELTQKAEAFQDRKVKLEDEKRELDRMIQKLQAEARRVEAKMGEIYQQEMSKFEKILNETIQHLANLHGWNIVMMEENLVFSNVSKTKEVIAELDKKAKAANQAKKQALESKETTKK